MEALSIILVFQAVLSVCVLCIGIPALFIECDSKIEVRNAIANILLALVCIAFFPIAVPIVVYKKTKRWWRKLPEKAEKRHLW